MGLVRPVIGWEHLEQLIFSGAQISLRARILRK